ncbi:MAG: hydrogenase expression/formation protein HypE [Bacteroidales bacterium]
MKKEDKILLGHGSGGKLSHELISRLFIRYFQNPWLDKQTDSAIIKIQDENLAFTTDSYVVDPIFFPGGNIGKLAICGTVNDLAVAGAVPLYISAGFIIEEGFSFSYLEAIVKSMAEEAKLAGVKIVTGDTKVVNRGKCDKIFINTAGVGSIENANAHIGEGSMIRPGDQIIINGFVGDHGMAVMAAREELNIRSDITSDCASLNKLINKILHSTDGITFMRDATRGGVATVLAELAGKRQVGIHIEEDSIPVRPQVRSFCELLGFDPLYVANEGKVLIFARKETAGAILKILHRDELGREARIIGHITSDHPGRAWIQTSIGGKRILDMLAGEQLPRIC